MGFAGGRGSATGDLHCIRCTSVAHVPVGSQLVSALVGGLDGAPPRSKQSLVGGQIVSTGVRAAGTNTPWQPLYCQRGSNWKQAAPLVRRGPGH